MAALAGYAMIGRRALLYVVAVALVSPLPSAAATAGPGNVPIAGGAAALARALHLNPVPDRARFAAELARIIYDVPEGHSAETDTLLRRLSTHLSLVSRFQTALAAAQPGPGGITLAEAAQKDGRKSLEAFLDLVGLRLDRTRNAYRVGTSGTPPDTERTQLFADLGVDPTALATALNAGRAVRIDVKADEVPIPLTAAVWSRAVFGRDVPAAHLFQEIITDRQASLLCHGLAGLDDPTRQFLADHPDVLTRLYQHDAPAFAAFGDALRIADGKVVVAGGPAAAALWEGVLDEKITRPAQFVRELFGRDGGRAAYVYDVLAQLDGPRRAFALGTWQPAGRRLDRFKALVATAGHFPAWKIAVSPFSRPPVDIGLVLARTRVAADGSPSPPAAQTLWSNVFDGAGVPDSAPNDLRNLRQPDPIDAAWLVDHVAVQNPTTAIDRLQQLEFGQRVFGQAPAEALPDAFLALRALTRYQLLVLTLDSLGVRTPSVYVAAARQAARVTALDPNRAFVALEQYQGCLALLARLARVHRLTPPAAETLVRSLAAIPLGSNGRYNGGIARWLRAMPELPAGDDPAALASVLAGPAADAQAPPPTPIAWEGQEYRVDPGAADRERIARIRRSLGASPLGLGLAVEQVAESLAATGVDLAAIRHAQSTLQTLAAALPEKATWATPPGVTTPKNPRAVLMQAAQDLSTIDKPADVRKAQHVVEPLEAVADATVGDALGALAYAVDMGDSSSVLVGQENRRHDFGLTSKDGDDRERLPWQPAAPQIHEGVPWHMRGSLLGLGLALAHTRLRRVESDERTVAAPVLLVPERDTLAFSAIRMDPFALRDADLTAIAAAVQRGRDRVAGLAGHPDRVDALADEIDMDGWRRAAVRWALTDDPAQVLSYFALSDLLALGDAAHAVRFDRWGTAEGITGSNLDLEWPLVQGGWRLFMGRPQFGLITTQVQDLTLNVALALDALHLPAQLAPGVLAEATEDFIDSARPLYPDDWLTLERTAQAVGRARMEDYVAALAAGGPLVPAHEGSHRP